MTPGACFHHRTKAAVCLAALALAPSAAWSQSVRGSLAGAGDQLTQQTRAYSVQPVYLEAEASPVGQDDLVQPLYASPQLGAGDFPDDAFFAPGSFFDDTQGASGLDDGRTTALAEDPNNGLISVEPTSLATPADAVTTAQAQVQVRPQSGSMVVNEDGTEFGLRPNALVFDSESRPFELVGDMGSFGSYEPSWDGSGEQIFLAYPYVDIRLGDRIYLSNDRGLGVNLFGTRNAEVSAAIDYRLPRRKEDVLRSVEEVTGAVTLGGRLNVYIRELGLFMNTDLGVYGDMRGWDVEVGMSSVQPLTDRMAMKITGAVSWADKRLLDNKFQVSAEDAAELGVSEYKAEQFGLKDMRVKGELKLFLTDHFGLYGASEVKVLLEQAAASPLVDELGEAVQFSTNLGLIYRF